MPVAVAAYPWTPLGLDTAPPGGFLPAVRITTACAALLPAFLPLQRVYPSRSDAVLNRLVLHTPIYTTITVRYVSAVRLPDRSGLVAAPTHAVLPTAAHVPRCYHHLSRDTTTGTYLPDMPTTTCLLPPASLHLPPACNRFPFSALALLYAVVLTGRDKDRRLRLPGSPAVSAAATTSTATRASHGCVTAACPPSGAAVSLPGLDCSAQTGSRQPVPFSAGLSYVAHAPPVCWLLLPPFRAGALYFFTTAVDTRGATCSTCVGWPVYLRGLHFAYYILLHIPAVDSILLHTTTTPPYTAFPGMYQRSAGSVTCTLASSLPPYHGYCCMDLPGLPARLPRFTAYARTCHGLRDCRRTLCADFRWTATTLPLFVTSRFFWTHYHTRYIYRLLLRHARCCCPLPPWVLLLDLRIFRLGRTTHPQVLPFTTFYRAISPCSTYTTTLPACAFPRAHHLLTGLRTAPLPNWTTTGDFLYTISCTDITTVLVLWLVPVRNTVACRADTATPLYIVP